MPIKVLSIVVVVSAIGNYRRRVLSYYLSHSDGGILEYNIRINAYRHSFFPSTIMLWNSLPIFQW